MANAVRIKDFSRKRKTAVHIKVDDRKIDCFPKILPEALQELVEASEEITLANAKEKTSLFFHGCMQAEDAQYLADRLADPWDDFGVEDATEIMLYLLEQYGMRPTQSSSGKSAGSRTDGAGTPSEAGLSAEASTPLTTSTPSDS